MTASQSEKTYQVSFYNEFVNAYGKVFQPCQRSFALRSGASRIEVLKAAKLLFAEREAVQNWKLRARRVELIEIG